MRGTRFFLIMEKKQKSFAESFDENVVYCLKYARNRETAMNYTIEDKKLIREVFNALTKVRVTGETDQRTEDFQDILTFELPMGKSWHTCLRSRQFSGWRQSLQDQ